MKEQIAAKYVRNIRNVVKREYAQKYLAFVLDGRPYEFNAPTYDSNKLSYMAAQAVRMNIDTICK